MKTSIKRLPAGVRCGLRIGVLLVVALHSTARAQEEKLYYFVDENGVTHLSNKPSDPRYKPFRPPQRGKAPATSLKSDPSPGEEPNLQDQPTPEIEDPSPEGLDREPPVVPEPAPGRER